MKFKNTKTSKKVKSVKKEGKSFKFPSISRFIPEKVSDEFIFLLGLGAILTAGLIVGLDLYRNLSSQRVMAEQTSQLQASLNFWQNEVKTRPNYRDAYFSLALINFQLKNFETSKENLNKALSIDPNFKEGIEFQKVLNNY